MNAHSFIPAYRHAGIHPGFGYILGLCCGLIVAAGIVAISPAPGLRCVSYVIGEAK